MILDLGSLDWLALALAALAAFLLGALWYTALFGRLWVRLQGFSPADVQRMQAARPPHVFFGGMLLSYGATALALGLTAPAAHVQGAVDGATLGLVFWLAAAGIGVTSWLASERRAGVLAIDLAFQLVFLVVQGAIVGAWASAGAP